MGTRTGFGWVWPPWSSNCAACFRKNNILKEYPTQEITTSRALSFQSFYAFEILYHFLGDVSNWIFTPFFIMSPKIMTLLGGTFAKRYFGEVPLPEPPLGQNANSLRAFLPLGGGPQVGEVTQLSI